MNIEWVNKKKSETEGKFYSEKERLRQEILKFDNFKPDARDSILKQLDGLKPRSWTNIDSFLFNIRPICMTSNVVNHMSLLEYDKWYRRVNFDALRSGMCGINYDNYLDSVPKAFDGDIIITDPCYVIDDDDWYAIDVAQKFVISDGGLLCNRSFGGMNFIYRDTIYGDWGCTTFNTDTKEVIGNFCADAGLVSVFLLDEVLQYDPSFDYHINRTWTTTLIKDFKGTVQFVVVYEDGHYKDETKYHKKGEHWEDYSVEVVGHGINRITGKPINFVGRQTGL